MLASICPGASPFSILFVRGPIVFSPGTVMPVYARAMASSSIVVKRAFRDVDRIPDPQNPPPPPMHPITYEGRRHPDCDKNVADIYAYLCASYVSAESMTHLLLSTDYIEEGKRMDRCPIFATSSHRYRQWCAAVRITHGVPGGSGDKVQEKTQA